uniref:Proteasome subunit beta putative n=1 Tax=Albugo laibachii Nc14 TaxID=890382 RepID=F0WBE8_9STRA|nr:proteasome subunit beta putative [Albugo laibachii Nc14]|eukprot:CCA18472.1 proteasome subunit beta putative [Albugo laibachii Nc14]
MPLISAHTTEGDTPLHLNPCDTKKAVSGTHNHHRAAWEPYDFNGGTALAIAGPDYVVIAGDSRLSTGYSILSRNEKKLQQLTSTSVLASPGSHNDVIQLRGMLQLQIQMYMHDNQAIISTENLSQVLMNTLYSRRFFPYYAFCVLAGIDKDGKGAVYSYDAIGSYDRVSRGAVGSGGHLMIPLLDNLVEHYSRTDPKREFTQQETKEIIKDAFITAGERDIYTGDCVEIMTITASGIEKEHFELKKD